MAQAASSPEIRDKVRGAYSGAAERPSEKQPFPVGRAFAESLGYPVALLDSLPPVAVEAFAGISNVSLFSQIREGANVLDVGCGAGLDSLIAARRVHAALARPPKHFALAVSMHLGLMKLNRSLAPSCALLGASQQRGEQLPVQDFQPFGVANCPTGTRGPKAPSWNSVAS